MSSIPFFIMASSLAADRCSTHRRHPPPGCKIVYNQRSSPRNDPGAAMEEQFEWCDRRRGPRADRRGDRGGRIPARHPARGEDARRAVRGEPESGPRRAAGPGGRRPGRPLSAPRQLRGGALAADIEEIFYLREALELAAVRLAYDRIPADELRDAEEGLDSLSPEDSPREDLLASDDALHDLIARYSGNGRLRYALKQLSAQIEFTRRTSMSRKGRLAANLAEHKELVAALKLGDLPLIEARLRVHLKAGKESTLEACRSLPSHERIASGARSRIAGAGDVLAALAQRRRAGKARRRWLSVSRESSRRRPSSATAFRRVVPRGHAARPARDRRRCRLDRSRAILPRLRAVLHRSGRGQARSPAAPGGRSVGGDPAADRHGRRERRRTASRARPRPAAGGRARARCPLHAGRDPCGGRQRPGQAGAEVWAGERNRADPQADRSRR